MTIWIEDWVKSTPTYFTKQPLFLLSSHPQYYAVTEDETPQIKNHYASEMDVRH
jgi:hypothetical protein